MLVDNLHIHIEWYLKILIIIIKIIWALMSKYVARLLNFFWKIKFVHYRIILFALVKN
jgi:hypothetical protein